MGEKIGLIAPYEHLIDRVRDISKGKDIFLFADSGVLEKTLDIAKYMVFAGAEAIVIRQYSDIFLKGKIDVPIIPIKLTSAAILDAVLKAMELPGEIAIANFKNAYRYIDYVKKVLHVDIHVFPFTNKKNLEQELRSLPPEVKTVIGGGLTRGMVNELGLNFVMLQSSDESIEQALESASLIIKYNREKIIKSEQLRSVVDLSSKGIITINDNYQVTNCNQIMEMYLGLSEKDFTSLTDSDCALMLELPNDFFRGHEKQKTVNVKGRSLRIKSIPIVNNSRFCGLVITAQETHQNGKTYLPKISSFKKNSSAKFNFDHILGKSRSIIETKKEALKIAKTDFTVLITGETGTGKEMFAQSIYNNSKRKNSPFLAINCASIPANLLESELFGYEEGAFTGAKKGGKPGYFEMVDTGTIFLDEVNSIPIDLQSRLLRVLQENEVIRVGGTDIIPVDIRVLAAANVNLHDSVKNGQFRSDLYFRLNVLNLHIPPLRDRKDDIPLISGQKLKLLGFNEKQIYQILNVLEDFHDHDWPGNVRELENVIINLSVKLQNDKILTADRIRNILCQIILPFQTRDPDQKFETDEMIFDDLKSFTKESEKMLIIELLQDQKLTKSEIAKKLGVSRATFWRKLKKYDLSGNNREKVKSS